MLADELKFRDPQQARALTAALRRAVTRPISVMHICGSHEQAIGRFGLRAAFPKGLEVVMGPGCPVCVTDAPEVDEGVALAAAGVRIATYGDMLKVPGTLKSLVGFGVRQLAKLIPVYGQTAAAAASAATSFAVTFALGKAAVHFLSRRQRGLHFAGTASAYQQGLREALSHARRNSPATPGSHA